MYNQQELLELLFATKNCGYSVYGIKSYIDHFCDRGVQRLEENLVFTNLYQLSHSPLQSK